MTGQDLVYVIPPYLLNTALGHALQLQLRQQNEELAALNVTSTSSPYYYNKPTNTQIEPYQFSSDPVLNSIIKEKLLYKLSIIGALGNSPKDHPISDAYLHELFDIFKPRLLEDDDKNDADRPKKHFGPLKPGEVQFLNTLSQVPEKYLDYLSLPFKKLLLAAKLDTCHKYKFPASFIKLDDGSFFDYSLPVAWCPLVSSKHLSHLSNNLNLSVHNDRGLSSIRLSTEKYDAASAATANYNRNSYYNFVSDKLVDASCGIFYYEVEVLQEATEATDFKPIIVANDASVSSETSLHFCLGYAKRHILLESNIAPSTVQQKTHDIDIEVLKDDIVHLSQNDLPNHSVDEDVEALLAMKPGEFKGSYAANFEDLFFYNSAKGADSIRRSAILNMNRRLSQLNRQVQEETDNHKIDIEIPFNTYLTKGLKAKTIFKTDVVGCGINYIDKCFFFTLNGVLVKEISRAESTTHNQVNEDVFTVDEGSKKNTRVYPIVGFQVNTFAEVNISSNPTKAEVRANFGFKEFKFNINSYTQGIKEKTQRALYLSLLDNIHNNKLAQALTKTEELENSLLNIKNDPTLLNMLIRGYLNHEGYLQTANSFEKDLKSLKNATLNADPDNASADSLHIFARSHANNRVLIKGYIASNQLGRVERLLKDEYEGIINPVEMKEIIYDLKYHTYFGLLKNYLEIKLNMGIHEFDFGSNRAKLEQEALLQATQYGKLLQGYNVYPEKLKKINEISSMLLVTSRESLVKFPKVKLLLVNYSKSLTTLFDKINQLILTSLGFKDSSNLETIIKRVHNNINSLSLEHNDDEFLLINFEKDYID